MKKFYRNYQVVTNLTCNLACEYCYESMTGQKNNIKDVIDFLSSEFERDYAKHKELHEVIIDFIGGEPFLMPDLMDKTMEYVLSVKDKYKMEHLFFSISTNATKITTDRVKEIIRKYKDYLWIGVSLDGTKEKHDAVRKTHTGKGSFDDCLAGYNFLVETLGQHRVTIKATFTRDTIKDYAKSAKFLLSQCNSLVAANYAFEEKYTYQDGVNMALQALDVMDYMILTNSRATFDHIITYDNPNDRFSVTEKYKFKERKVENRLNSCGSGTGMISIGFDRKVYGCNRFLTMGRDDTAIGYLDENNNLVKYEKDLSQLTTKTYDLIPESCKNCHLVESCSNCIALPIEEGCTTEEEITDYYETHKQCSWTKTKEVARLYYAMRLKAIEKSMNYKEVR